MLDVLVDLILVLTLLAALMVIGYMFLVVRAMHKELTARGVATELIPKKKREHGGPLSWAEQYMKRRGEIK